jgi:hypothetical protein
MEVGANLIARAAHATLKVIAKLRETFDIQLAWSPDWDIGVRIIGVYPTAARYSPGAPPASGTLESLDHLYELGVSVSPRQKHECDAVVCAIAGLELLRHRAVAPSSPDDVERARREGWIWVGNSPRTTGG